MKTALRIRACRPSDTAAILELTAAVFAPASIDARIEELCGGTPWEVTKSAVVRRELEQNRRGCFVAVRNGRVIGYVTTSLNAVARRGTIANLAVAAECRGQGVGRRLLKRVISHFRRLGLHHAKIETLETNAAGRHLYPALGFREVARQIHYALPLAKRCR
jgi:ribosomal protein S18 acetylase RimI-like enzyme